MKTFDWQEQLAKRQRRTKYERVAMLLFVAFIMAFGLWQFIYADTPEYALEQVQTAITLKNTDAVKKYCDLDSLTGQAYDDLTRDMFAKDETLSDKTKVMFEQFYVKIKPQVVEETNALILNYIQCGGTWQSPGGSNILKGRQLGIDYEYLIERSQLRNTKITKLDSVTRNGEQAKAKIQVQDIYTNTTFVLSLTMEKRDGTWKITKINNYRDFLDFLAPIQTAGMESYVKATSDIIDKYIDILDTQQTNFKLMTATSEGRLSSNQRTKICAYIRSDIIPALEKRQHELDQIPVNDGAQYISSLRKQSTNLSIQSWQHFAEGIEEDNITALGTAKAFHKDATDIERRIDDLLKNTAVNKIAKIIP